MTGSRDPLGLDHRVPVEYAREDRMSFLRNPSFENDKDFWTPVNLPGSVTFSVGTGTVPLPVTGSKIASIVSLVPLGSIGQDASVDAPSVSCFAHVTSITGNSTGFLNIWNLTTGAVASTPFTVQNPGAWQLVMNTLDLGGKANVRVEIYSNTPGGQVLLDYVNLF